MKQEPIEPLDSPLEKIEGLPLPKKIGPYRIESFLQKGGMSLLYLGVQEDDEEGQLTTIKVLLPKFLHNRDVVDRFLLEAEIIALADHPNVVKMLGHGEWEGGLYIAMEYITGMSLRQYILQTPISLRRALEIVLNIAYALCHLHTHGIIHRDLKPENILVTEYGQIKVIDFGIAHQLNEMKYILDSAQGPRTIGTPIYMSPEQRQNPELVSYPSDIYSLGIIAYELVLGKLSYGQLHLSLMPKGLKKILSKALQPKLEDRYLDVVDFISDLSSYLHSIAAQSEKLVADQISEIYESFIRAQRLLNGGKGFNWSYLKVGVAMHYENVLHSSYSDFIDRADGGHCILLGEALSSSVEGVIQAAMVRGMAHALVGTSYSPKEIVNQLNQLLSSETPHFPFGLCFLSIDASYKTLRFCSCGYGQLWLLPFTKALPNVTSQAYLGSDSSAFFEEAAFDWQDGQDIFLVGFLSDQNAQPFQALQTALVEALMERHESHPQKIVDAVLRKVKSNPSLKLPTALFLVLISK